GPRRQRRHPRRITLPAWCPRLAAPVQSPDGPAPAIMLARVVARLLELPAVPRGQDDLGHRVAAQPQLLRYLLRAHPLLVVEEREPGLLAGPRLAGLGGRAGPRCPRPGVCPHGRPRRATAARCLAGACCRAGVRCWARARYRAGVRPRTGSCWRGG